MKAPLFVAFAAVLSFSAAAEARVAEVEVAALTPQQITDGAGMVVARVDLSDQTMHLYVDNQLLHVWDVSTGYGADATPTGEWNAYWLSPNHRSSLFNGAPMPWSVFFSGNYAVHGTTAVEFLGQPASHGCVRLDTANAETFFRLVEQFGLYHSRVVIVD